MAAAARRSSVNWDVAVAVLAVVLIVYVWLSSLVYVLIPWLEQSGPEHWLAWSVYLGTVHLVAVMVLWSFLSAALTSPGELQAEYEGRMERVRCVLWEA